MSEAPNAEALSAAAAVAILAQEARVQSATRVQLLPIIVMSEAPNAEALSAAAGGLKATETRAGGGGADAEVIKLYEAAWDELSGDKDKVCEKLGLDANKWGDIATKEAFVKKFLG